MLRRGQQYSFENKNAFVIWLNLAKFNVESKTQIKPHLETAFGLISHHETAMCIIIYRYFDFVCLVKPQGWELRTLVYYNILCLPLNK